MHAKKRNRLPLFQNNRSVRFCTAELTSKWIDTRISSSDHVYMNFKWKIWHAQTNFCSLSLSCFFTACLAQCFAFDVIKGNGSPSEAGKNCCRSLYFKASHHQNRSRKKSTEACQKLQRNTLYFGGSRRLVRSNQRSRGNQTDYNIKYSLSRHSSYIVSW